MGQIGLGERWVAEGASRSGIDAEPEARVLSHQADADLARLVDVIERRERHDEEPKRRSECRAFARRDARPFQSLFVSPIDVVSEGKEAIVNVQIAGEGR